MFGATLYSAAGREHLSQGSTPSLGCGVPRSLTCAKARPVLDLDSGAGADVLISAGRVAPTGEAIGLDMTDAMLELARASC